MTRLRPLLIALLIPLLLAGCDVFGSNDESDDAADRFDSVEIRGISVFEIPNFSESSINLGTNIYDNDADRVVWRSDATFPVSQTYDLRTVYDVRYSFSDLSTPINVGLTKSGSFWTSTSFFTLAEMLEDAAVTSQQQEYEISEGRIRVVIFYAADPA